VGPCLAEPTPHCEVFVIVFDHNGKAIDNQGLGVPSDDLLANFGNDTRSDRTVAR
jgi:hypothetical protein